MSAPNDDGRPPKPPDAPAADAAHLAPTKPAAARPVAPRPPPVPGSATQPGARPAAPRPPVAPQSVAGQPRPIPPQSVTGQARPAAPAPRPVAPGAPTQVHDYRILKLLGRGGMAEVFLAERAGKQVALKRLLPEYARDPEIVRRFMLEMKAGAAIRNEHVVEIVEFGEHEGTHFLATEFMDAGSVRDLFVRAKGRVPPNVAEAIAVMLLRGLAVAHMQKLIHRDIKPANVLLSSNGTAKLSDFGIARALEMPGLTRTGLLVGTPSYMSPEQARGDQIDTRSDLFAAGILVYELLTGFNPFMGQNEAGSLMKVATSEPPLLFEVNPALPPHLESFVNTLLRKDPAHRFQTAEEALADLALASPMISVDPKAPVRDALADPPGAWLRWAEPEAKAWYQRASQLMSAGVERRPQVLLALHRAHTLAPGATLAEARLRELMPGQDPFGPPRNPKITEVEATLAKDTGNHVLWLQLASLYRLEKNVVRSVACLKRAVWLRPDDGFAVGQLRTALGDEAELQLGAAPLTLKTMPKGPSDAPPGPAPAFGASGGDFELDLPPAPASAAPAPRERTMNPGAGPRPRGAAPTGSTVPSTAPAPYVTPTRSEFPLGKIVLVLLAVGLVWGIVRGLSGFIDKSVAETDAASNQLAKGFKNGGAEVKDQIDIRRMQLRDAADRAFAEAVGMARAHTPGAAEALRKFRDDNPKHPRIADAQLLLGEVLVDDRLSGSAVGELERFIRDFPTEPRVPEARWLLGRAYDENGDKLSALRELEGLVNDHPSSPLVTRAIFKQAEIYEAQGDAETARARYEAVRSRTGPVDRLHIEATGALSRLATPNAAKNNGLDGTGAPISPNLGGLGAPATGGLPVDGNVGE